MRSTVEAQVKVFESLNPIDSVRITVEKERLCSKEDLATTAGGGVILQEHWPHENEKKGVNRRWLKRGTGSPLRERRRAEEGGGIEPGLVQRSGLRTCINIGKVET
ncbi:hypothetical protein APICC_00880 [Apis cerana cerana]|uniref:Uncharacterized protein n=1 Tax=Apis cerana cerana TaxID=94128 RepID=A0A2A3E6M3_APICC|nr:hypothetical protein APICC_00880 [Apis cerana cerana]